MRSIHKLVRLDRLIYSSPVIMLLLVIVTPDDDCIWMPSVVGLVVGAIIFTFRIKISLQYELLDCLSILSQSPQLFLDQLNYIDCIKINISSIIYSSCLKINSDSCFFFFIFSREWCGNREFWSSSGYSINTLINSRNLSCKSFFF